MLGIYRAIGGISLNGREWVLDDDGDIMKFKTHQDAVNFLKANTNVKNETDMELGLKWVHVARYELVLKQVRAILPSVSVNIKHL